ncbi:MAG TPA: helix-turn-helix domain-containing protein [Armatimonadota bacterium]|nr:helix-turn-helix domain-containing protein [Armatimonadota bacterium]
MASGEQAPAHPRETLTVPEAAKRLGIGRRLAYEMARTGKFPTIRLGRRVLIPRQRFEAWLQGQVPGG